MRYFGKPLLLGALAMCICSAALAQIDSTNSLPDSANAITDIYKSTVPKEYRVGKVVVTGNKYFDQALLIQVANLNTGDKVILPGGDNFGKAITKLWEQNYFSDVTIYITSIDQPNILNLEINVQERPRLGKVIYTGGVSKSNQEDLAPKTSMISGRIITESMKQNASDAIRKFYVEKGYRNIKIDIKEIVSNTPNTRDLSIAVSKGDKVKISSLHIAGNETVSDNKLKKQFKGTKEMGRLSVHPTQDTGYYEPDKPITFKHFVQNYDFLRPSGVKEFIEPYFRFKPFCKR